MRFTVLPFLFVGLIGSASADVCCPSGCVPLYNGTLACVHNSTGTACGTGATCNTPPSPGSGPSGTGTGGAVVPVPPGPVCTSSLICTYSNGVATIKDNEYGGPGVVYKGPQPPRSVYTRVVYAKGCVGGGASLEIPFDGQSTLNLYNLHYNNFCTNELPMTFIARVGAIPETAGSCDCSVELPAPPYGRDSCREGFIWRGATQQDHVCVTPARHDAVVEENANAGSTRAGKGKYGANTCKPGFVWRAAAASDLVCVTPASREQVKAENAVAWDRVAHIAGQ
jgi:hypothetical protein